MENKLNFDRVASLVFLALGVIILAYSYTLPSQSYGTTIGASAMPRLLGFLLILLSIINVYCSWKKPVGEKKKEDLDYKTFLPYLAALIVYALVIELLGYVISTFLFLVFCFQLMRRGHIVKSILIAAVFSLGVYVVYVYGADGTLPPMPIIGF